MSTAFVENLIRFEEALHGAGLPGSSGRILDAITAVEAVGIKRRDDVRAALAAVFVDRRDEIALFHRVFDLFWRVRSPGVEVGDERDRLRDPTASATVELEYGEDDLDESESVEVSAGIYSWEGVPREKDFAEFTPEELARAEVLFDRLDWQLGVRRARRFTSASSGAIDLRRVLAKSRGYGGELIDLPRRRRIIKPRPLIVLADVSGSMERYSRVLLQFVYALTRGAHHVESFVFATRLTRITRAAADRSRARSVDHLVQSVQDWGGGTRIGEALRTFSVKWARRVIRNGPIVLLISDGWDRGEPAALVRELARIRRSCKRVIWLNPLLGAADYEPLTRGMRAALPLVDDFMTVHNLASLETLARHIRSLSEGTKNKGQRTKNGTFNVQRST